MKRSALSPSGHAGQLVPANQYPVVVQQPGPAHLIGMAGQMLANPNAVVEQAVSMIDESHSSVTIRERVVIYVDDD